MKTIKRLTAGLLLAATLTLTLCSCASTGVQAPPSSIEKALYNVTTNVTTLTNYQTITQTNVQTVTITNVDLQVITKVVTNEVPVLVPTLYNVTNYTFDAKPAITGTAAGLGAMAGPWGTVAAAALAGILGIWGKYRSNQADTANAVAATSQQAIATAKQVIAAMPNGAALSTAFNTFLTQHAADANLASEIASIVDEVVDPHAATGAALAIVTAATTPIPTATTATGVKPAPLT